MSLADFLLTGHTFALDLLARLQPFLFKLASRVHLGDVSFGSALDGKRFHFVITCDARLFYGACLVDLEAFGLLFGPDARLGDGNLRCRPFRFNLTGLLGLLHFDVARLINTREFQLAINFDDALLGFEILCADLHSGFIFNLIPQFPASFGFLHDQCHTFGVELVSFVKIAQRSLVQRG